MAHCPLSFPTTPFRLSSHLWFAVTTALSHHPHQHIPPIPCSLLPLESFLIFKMGLKPPYQGFSDGSAGKESACNAGDPCSIPGLGRSTGEEIGYPLQYSWASLLAQLVKNPPSMQETWVGRIPWRRERLPTPVLWPGEFHGLYSPWGRKKSNTTERLSLCTLSFWQIGRAHV